MLKIILTFVVLAISYDVSFSNISKNSSHHLRTSSLIGTGANTQFGDCDFFSMTEKKCPKCKRVLLLDKNFGYDRSNKDGRSYACFDCRREKTKGNQIIIDLEGEIWKDVNGYEGYYEISNKGRVKRMERLLERDSCSMTNIAVYRKLLKVVLNRGYYMTRLSKDGKSNHVFIHRLMAMAFIPNPENKKTINHKNGIKTDNRFENLEWATYSENNYHAWETGLKFRRKIIQMDMEGNEIKIWDSLVQLNKFGYCKSSICNCCYDKRNSYKGFKWKYA